MIYDYAFVKKPKEKAEEINRQLQKAARELSPEIYTYCLGKIQRQQYVGSVHDQLGEYWTAWQNRELLCQLQNGTYTQEFYKQPGVYDLYIPSNLDDSIVKLSVRVPQNYQPEKAYPA